MIEPHRGVLYESTITPGAEPGVVVRTLSPTAGSRPLLTCYGDSYTANYADGWSPDSPGWARIVADTQGLQLANNARPGTGWVATDAGRGPTFSQQVQQTPPADGGVVVVFGGLNDWREGAGADAVGRGADACLALVRARAPHARLLVVGPQWPATSYAPGMEPLRAAVQAAAVRQDGTFLDALQWLAGRPELIGPDGLHLTPAGLALVADLIGPTVAALAAA